MLLMTPEAMPANPGKVSAPPRSLCLARILALGIACALPLGATALQQLSLTQITQAATEIVEGAVTGAQTAQSGSTIFTVYNVQVTQRMKGPANPTATVAIPGGSLHGIRQSFPGVPVLVPGRQYLLFLWTGATGPTQLVGLNQGVLEIGGGSSGSSSETFASRPASTETMLDAQHKPTLDRPVHLKLADLRQRIQSALAPPKSSPGKPVHQ